MKGRIVSALIVGALSLGLAFAGYHAPEPGDQAKKEGIAKRKVLNPKEIPGRSVFRSSRNRRGHEARLMPVKGKGYLLNESFEGNFPPDGWSTEVVSGSYDWEQHEGTLHPSGYPAHTGDYLAVYNSWSASSGSNARLITDTIDLTDVTNPVLSFWMFHDAGYSYNDDSLVVEIKASNNGTWPSDWTPLESYMRHASSTEWVEHTIDLSAYIGYSVVIAFHAFSDYGNSIHIDDVSIHVPSANDVGVTSIIAPLGNYALGDQVTPQVVVQNFGTSDNTFDVTIEFADYNQTQSVNLASGAVDTVSFPAYTFNSVGTFNVTAYTSLSGDEDNSNDTATASFGVMNIVENFENNNGNFSADPQTGAWEWGTPADAVGPGGAFSGTKCWGTNLDGNYDNNADWYLYSPNLHALSDSAQIYFMTWYSIENYWDGGNVEISTDGGNTWTVIDPVGGYPGHSSSLGADGYTGSSGGWVLAHFDLYGIVNAGDYFQLRFHLASDGSVNYPGWYIDDFSGIGMEIFVPSYDVGVNQILGIEKYYETGETFTPSVEVQNFGNTTADFTVTLEILKGGNTIYSNVMNVTLASGAVDTVVFDQFNINASGIFDVVAYTTYSADVAPDNDTLRISFFVPDEVSTFNECTFPPVGWSSYILGDSLNNYGELTGWALWTDTTSWGHGDPYEGCSIWHNDHNVADSCNDWIVKGPVVVSDSQAAIAFYQRVYYAGYRHYHGIWISVNDPDPASGNFVELANITDSISSSWSLLGPISIPPEYYGDTVYIALVYRGDWADEWYVDNFMLVGAHTLPNDAQLGGSMPIEPGDTLGSTSTTLYSYVWNPPASTAPLNFRLNATVTHNGAVIYNQFATVQNLQPGEVRQVFFSPDFVPFESGEYILTITALFSNDPIPGNNMLVDTFYVDLFGGPQSGSSRKPRVFALRAVSPNPSPGAMTIAFDVAKTVPVNLKVYDASGRVVKVLKSGVLNPGSYTVRWNGKSDAGTKVAAGVYFIKYDAGSFHAMKRIILLGK